MPNPNLADIRDKISAQHEGDERQLEVIFSDSPRIIVEAPAGYGKTTTMISRIAYLFATGRIPNPKRILGLTFSVNAALKVILGKDVHQKGSNITPERMRFDFSCDHKLTDDEKKKVEDLVNEWISRGLDVKCEEMKKDDAIKSGAECMFIEKYPDIVTVYSIGNENGVVSKELCGGPHVKNTSELGHFKIKKEEASSAGVRRIKAILE